MTAVDVTVSPPAIRSVSVIGTIAAREIRRQLAQPAALITQAIQLGFFFLVYAIGIGSMVGASGDVSFVAYVFPGIVMIHLATAASSMGLSYAWDREYGFIRELLVAPAPRWTLPVGKAAGAASFVAAQCGLLLLFAPLADISLTVPRWILAVAACALAAGAFSLLGLLVAVTVRRAETAQGCVQIAMFPMLFLSGAVFRADTVPGWLAGVIAVNPLTYCVDLLRHTLLGPTMTASSAGSPGAEVTGLIIGAVGAVAIITRRLRG